MQKWAHLQIQIHKINNSVSDSPKVQVSLSQEKEFLPNENNFEFFYGVPNFNKTTNIKYQYLYG